MAAFPLNPGLCDPKPLAFSNIVPCNHSVLKALTFFGHQEAEGEGTLKVSPFSSFSCPRRSVHIYLLVIEVRCGDRWAADY